MLRNLYLVFLLFLAITTSLPVMAQHERDVIEARPVGGIEALADVYNRIHFTDVQKRQLQRPDVELLFKVSRQGEAELHRTEEIWDEGVRDSLYSRNDSLPRFEPKMENGFSVPSFYALRTTIQDGLIHLSEVEILFPSFGIQPTSRDIQELERGKRDISLGQGIGANAFAGGLGKILNPGFSLYLDARFPRMKHHHDWVIGMEIMFNQRIGEFALDPELEQVELVSSIALNAGYSLRVGEFDLTPALGFMGSGLANGENDDIYEIRYGVGFAVSRTIFSLREQFFSRIQGPSFRQRNVILAIRSNYYFAGSDILGTGAMFDLCLKYSIGWQSLNSYRFKDSFYEQP